jgi:hypothetical protein
MSHLRELRAWTHELFDQYGWLILANYSRNTRHVRSYIRSMNELRKTLREYYEYSKRSRKSNNSLAPLMKMMKQVDLLARRIDKNYGNRNNNNRRYRYNY